MLDEFKEMTAALTSPATKAEEIFPDDIAKLNYATRAVYVGVAGNVRAKMISGDIVTLTNVGAGIVYPIRVDQVFATGTTASGLVGLR